MLEAAALIFGLIHALVLAFAAAELARNYGRPTTTWFIGGLLFGEFSLLGLLLKGRADLPTNHICPACQGVHSLP